MSIRENAKVVIIGSGPAGYTAAVYTGRANLEPILYEGGGALIEPITIPGGQLMITTEVENYPGFPKGVQGPELMELFKQQALRFGTRVRTTDVTEVDLRSRPFRVVAGDEEVLADAVIVATGASAKWLGIPSEQHLMNYGVSACATCDGALFKGRELIVVGGGDTAMEEATFLTRFATKVTVVHRREEFRASKIMLERAQRNPKIDFIVNATIEEILGQTPKPGVTGLRLRSTKTGEVWTHGRRGGVRGHRTRAQLEAVQGATGHEPGRLPGDQTGIDPHQHRRGVCLRGRGRPRLPAGGHRRRDRLHGRDRRRALPGPLTAGGRCLTPDQDGARSQGAYLPRMWGKGGGAADAGCGAAPLALPPLPQAANDRRPRGRGLAARGLSGGQAHPNFSIYRLNTA